jgi:hypothetical protein
VARDLIPPPSPAGRPSPDPEPHDPVAALHGSSPDAEPGKGEGALGPSPFRTRFGFVTGVLLGCALAAGVLALTLLTAGGDPEEGLAPNWSAWKPSTTQPFNGASEIADHVEVRYRDAKKKQLVSVTGGPPAVGTLPLSVAVQPRGGDIELIEGVGVQYTLNGLGRSGSFRDGKRSNEARARLLRREALELALYSFRYLPEVTAVVALLPPEPVKSKKGAAAAKGPDGDGGKAAAAQPELELQAMLYRPGDLRPQLEVPLDATISPRTPRLDEFAGEEARRVDSLTLSNLFKAQITQAQDARAYLVLERPK